MDYFLHGTYLSDINLESKITTSKGAVARQFALFFSCLFCSKEPFSPVYFKETIRKYWHNWDFQQQDAQEFLNFILDAIHEDVNKIITKPYIELPDLDPSISDEEGGKIFWDAHKKRNGKPYLNNLTDSIIVDLFQGQYKSKISCKDCLNTSIKFEAFMNLGLELPRVEYDFQALFINENHEKYKCRVKYSPNTKFQDIIEEIIKPQFNVKGVQISF